MRRGRLLWRLFPTYLLITLLALVTISIVAWYSMRQLYTRQAEESLTAQCHLAELQIADNIRTGNLAPIDASCKEMGRVAGIRITIILPDGRVIGDSEANIATLDNHSTRPEIAAALQGKKASNTRLSATLHEEMLYVAEPLYDNGKVIGVARISIPMLKIEHTLQNMRSGLVLSMLFVFLAAAALSVIVSRRISRPLEIMRQGAERFAQGDLTIPLVISNTDEIGALATSLNSMAAQLNERIRTVNRQRHEQEAVLLSMIEGVVAFDKDERVLKMNLAGGRLLGVDAEKALGRHLQEVVRNRDLQLFVRAILTSWTPQEGEIVLRDKGERFMQTHGTVLEDEDHQRIGVLVVMNDVTSLRRLENVRRDFVANVSHELRTPITSIKGFVETLLDGSINDPEDARRFLEIIARHTNRLDAIIDDLLSLSRIEQGSEVTGGIVYEETDVCLVINAAVQSSQQRADAKEIRITRQLPDCCVAVINVVLLEQAIANLIDNAIKYSDPKSEILATLQCATDEVAISIHDNGTGIAPEHLPRLFERFYRIDNGRSRKQGGTGLGLAIVKHIAQAHHGTVTVESTLGEGSTFTIHLPRG
ncbi:MAG: ATP-binding protein [bacterium]